MRLEGKEIGLLDYKDPERYRPQANPKWVELHPLFDAIGDLRGKVLTVEGDSGTTSVITGCVCGENVSKGRALVMVAGLAYHFNISNASHYGLVIGVSLTSGVVGGTVYVTKIGKNSSVTGLTTGLQYAILAPLGGISNTPPMVGILQTVGVAVSPTSLMVNISKPYIKI